MPLYEYECDACGRRFERIQKFSDPPVETCPACGGAVRRLVSSPAIQFKGSGWYITDYARKGTDSSTKETKPATPADSSSGSTSSETKTSTSTESKPATSTPNPTKSSS